MKSKKKIFDYEYQQQREDLAGEHHLWDMLQLILLLVFLSVWISDTFFLRYSLALTGYQLWFLRVPLALAVLVTAGYLARAGLQIVFGEERETPGVIRKGVFSLVRHPIYLGAVLLYLGMLVFSLSLAAAGVWLVITALYVYFARYEEKRLIQMFGSDYEAYMREVPMMIPRIWRRTRKA